FLGNVELESISPEQVRNFLVSLEGVSPVTIHTHFRALRAFLNWCEKQAMIKANPIRNVSSPRLPERPPKLIEPEKQKALLDFLEKQEGPYAQRDLLFIMLLLGTGVSASEFCQLQVSDVSLESKQLTVRQGRLRENRTVPLEPMLAEKLSQYLTDLPEGQNYLFMTRRGIKFTSHSVSVIGRKYLKELGLSGSVQVFRHTFAANWMRKGGSLGALGKVMGQKTLDLTARYVSLSPEDLVRAMRRARPAEIIFEGREPSSED
ncbi:MAG TPA: tyrosine-type recombinase/integrase, partial [Anaerolineales bacterium]